MRPQLIVHTTYFPIVHEGDGAQEEPDDPERAAAVELGKKLYGLLTRPIDDPLRQGAGVPVRVATRFDHIDLEEAERVVIIPVLGQYALATQSVRDRAVAQINAWADALPLHHVLAIPRDASWRTQEPELAQKQLLTELYRPESTLDEILLTLARVLRPGDTHATQLFISHAKADLEPSHAAAKQIHDHVATDTTGAAFFDSVTLLAGDALGEQIDENAKRGIFVIVRGDAYSSRAWCQRELLIAKRHRLPTIAVEVLTQGEPRSLPYAGNCPTYVWNHDNEHSAGHIVRQAMVEGVRAALFELEGARVRELAELPSDTVVMTRPPELLDVEGLRRPGPTMVLHPEPELSVFEREVLHEAYPRLRLATPTSAYSQLLGRSFQLPLARMKVALSLSDTPEVDGPEGNIDEHVRDATVALARALVSSGAEIAYGGDFRDRGFTKLLIEVIGAYNQTASTSSELLHSFLASPIDIAEGTGLAFTAHSLGRFGTLEKRALLEPFVKQDPKDWPEEDRAALYFSDMRRLMGEDIQARVLLGGQAVPRGGQPSGGYGGRYAGVLEEAWRALDTPRPLYVAGGYGGAAGLVAELLSGAPVPPAFCEATWLHVERYEKLVAALDHEELVGKMGLPKTMDDMAVRVRAEGQRHLKDDTTSMAWNGLTLDENQTLFRTRDPQMIAALVMRGLMRTRERERTKRIDIELTRASLEDARELDVVVVPAFSDIELGGAGAMIDRTTNRSATRARDQGAPLALLTDAIDADYVHVANLGTLADASRDPGKTVLDTAKNTIAAAKRYGFTKLGLVTFLGNVAEDLSDVVGPMLDAMADAPAHTEWLWFETDQARFDRLEELLDADERVQVTVRKPPLTQPDERPDREPDQLFISNEPEALEVTLLLRRGNAVSPTLNNAFPGALREELRGGPFAGAPTAYKLRDQGLEVGRLLLGDAADRVVERLGERPLLLTHDAASSSVPYEALCVRNEAGELFRPALAGGIVRRLRVSGAFQDGFLRPPEANQLKVLLVVNPRGDLTQADKEGDAVAKELRAVGIELKELRREQATVEAVLHELCTGGYDVLHYCGHAFFHGTGDQGSGLVCSDGNLTLEKVARLKRVPRLAFVNACQAARFRGDASSETLESRAFAEFFLRAGVDAYLGTFWLVTDGGAQVFARVTYRELARGAQLGAAVIEGRKALFEAGNSDWANYLLYGHDGFRLVAN